MASTSDSLTPAVSSARCMVGSIASRCARLATSGTTPPNRAWASTLDAIASASSVWPRTMPIPVSSQEVSMPSTRGSDVNSHHHRIGVAGLVVTASHAHGLEAVTGVGALGGRVVGRHLEQEVTNAPPGGLADEVL